MRLSALRATFLSAIVVASSTAFLAAQQPRARYAIRTARILNPRSGQYSAASVILVRGGRITDVRPAASYRPNLADSTIDLRRLTVLPGLIDAHVHLGIGGPPARTALADLRAGFTTVVDLGARTDRILRIRDSINSGLMPGPRVLAAGLWVGIKGGVCEFNGIGIDGGADAFRARVRENVEAGADLIKLCVSGWPNEAFSSPQKYELTDEQLTAVVDEARRLRRRVIAHDISVGGVAAAVRAGVHGLAHTPYLDSETADAVAARGMFIIPTLASLVGSDTSPASRGLVRSIQTARQFNITLVFGTDGGVLPHGQNAEEFLALQRAGVTPLEAIRAATVNATRVFGLGDSLGIVARGMAADLIAVSGDPLTDLSVLKTPRFVMSRGRVVSP